MLCTSSESSNTRRLTRTVYVLRMNVIDAKRGQIYGKKTESSKNVYSRVFIISFATLFRRLVYDDYGRKQRMCMYARACVTKVARKCYTTKPELSEKETV